MKEFGTGIMLIGVGIALCVALVIGLIWGWQSIRVYVASQGGRAEYVRAEQNRKIKVLEAEAKKESATLEAQAEVERAKGVAQANEIVADSLRDNEGYLRYLWIDKLSDNQNVIYVPTEAGLPILEAGRRP